MLLSMVIEDYSGPSNGCDKSSEREFFENLSMNDVLLTISNRVGVDVSGEEILMRISPSRDYLMIDDIKCIFISVKANVVNN